VSQEDLAKRIGLYHSTLKHAEPAGAFVNNQAATFALAHCAQTTAQARQEAKESFEWYARKAFEYVGSVLQWTQELGGGKAMATYEYMQKMLYVDLTKATYDWMRDGDMVLSGDPEMCLRQARAYQQSGTEILLCHLQTYKIPHAQVMESIRLFGKHVIPHFK
jgi:alkanesulfonate monooxygenase SsuD/methylene tetrahydromethanopterin reductase-like flavin-dependent oxidoreductase (luciferase family)